MAIESPVAKQQFFDANGNPLVGGKLYIYEAGTTTPATTWTDKLQTAANANPIILDSRGECVIWLDTESAYKYVLKTALDVEVYSVDNVNGALAIDNLRTDLAADDGSSLIGYIAEGTGAVATTAQDKLRESVSVIDFGADPTGVLDSSTAFANAIQAVSNIRGGGAVFVPRGEYYLADDLVIQHQTQISGEGGLDYFGTKLLFEDGKGVRIYHYNDAPTPGNDGSWSVVSNLLIEAKAKTIQVSGIRMSGRARIQNVGIANFGQYGIHIGNDANGENGNANSWYLDQVRIVQCDSHGVFTHGGDSNAGVAILVDCSSNGGWGIYDSSFLGNTYIACHTANNTSGAYKTDNPNARNVFLGCYSESGQPASDIRTPSCVFGGLHGAGFTSDTYAFLIGGTEGFNASVVAMRPEDETATISIGKGSLANEFMNIYGPTLQYFRWCSRPGELCWTWANFSDVFAFYDRNNYAIRDLTNIGTVPGFPAGFLAEGQLSRQTAAAAPISGLWRQGDIVFNSAPTAGGTIGWVCTTAGTPGTWKTFGAISA